MQLLRAALAAALLRAPLPLAGSSRHPSPSRQFIPRSYWRFENASDSTVDEMGVRPLDSFEGIGRRGQEKKLWQTQAQGGLVGGESAPVQPLALSGLWPALIVISKPKAMLQGGSTPRGNG